MSPSCHTQNSIPHDYPGTALCKERLENQGSTIITLDNPCDFRLARDHVLKTIHRAIEENPGRRVVVLMGENHTIPSHLVFQEAVIRGLEQDQKPFILAQECGHNRVSYILNGIWGKDAPEVGALARDEYETLTRLLNISFGSEQSPLTKTLLCQEQHKRKIPTINCDLAIEYDDNNSLDTKDPWTRDIVASHSGSGTIDRISAISSEGVALRNIGMVEKLLEKTDDRDLVLLSTGITHLFGHIPIGFPYNESLYARLLQKGCVPVSFCFEDSHIKRGGLPIPEGARYHTTIQNADQRSFPHFLEDPSGKELKRAQEIFFMNDMPWPQGIKTPDDIQSLGKQNISNFLNLCEKAAIKMPKANPS